MSPHQRQYRKQLAKKVPRYRPHRAKEIPPKLKYSPPPRFTTSFDIFALLVIALIVAAALAALKFL